MIGGLQVVHARAVADVVTTSYRPAGVLLILAALWQLTPIKSVCLRHCRSPLSFLIHSWRPGRLGALRMWLEHGTYCLGCCWFLMGLLFFGGIMNLFWIAGFAGFVLLEKTIPLDHWLGRTVGIPVAAAGVFMLTTAAAAPNPRRSRSA
jgi:predicted metal-binding membrane protein